MKTKLNWFDRMMLSITFAEADVPEPVLENQATASTVGTGSKRALKQTTAVHENDADLTAPANA